MGTVPGSTRGSGLCWMSRGIITGSLRGKTRTHTVRPYRKQTLPEAAGLTIIALDVQSLDQATRILEENTIYQGRVAGLYGAGSTTSLLRALDRGIVTGLTAYNQFDEGYLSVKQAVEAIQGTRQKQNTVLEAIYVFWIRIS